MSLEFRPSLEELVQRAREVKDLYRDLKDPLARTLGKILGIIDFRNHDGHFIDVMETGIPGLYVYIFGIPKELVRRTNDGYVISCCDIGAVFKQHGKKYKPELYFVDGELTYAEDLEIPVDSWFDFEFSMPIEVARALSDSDDEEEQVCPVVVGDRCYFTGKSYGGFFKAEVYPSQGDDIDVFVFVPISYRLHEKIMKMLTE